MKKYLYIIPFIITIIVTYYYVVQKVIIIVESFEGEIETDEDTVITATLNIVGDLMCHSVQINYAHVEDDSFDFNSTFRELKEYLSDADFTIGNFETVLAGEKTGYSGYPFFNAPDEFLQAIKEAGFDLLITANNHALDQGIKGIKRTIHIMDYLQVNHTGTFTSIKDRDSIRIYNINGINIAVIAYSYSTNGIPIPKGMDYLINLIDYDLIKSDIEKARKDGADIVLTFYHFGEENEREPNKYQQEVVKKTIEAGGDIIIGSHPHVIQPIDYFITKRGRLNSGFVAYSLGNFISNQRWRYSDATVMLKLELSRNVELDSIYISNTSYLPAWVFKGNTDNGKEYIVLPSSSHPDDSIYYFLNQFAKQQMHQSLEDTRSIITKYTDRITLISP